MSGKLSILSLSVFGFSIWVKLNLLWKSCLYFFPPWFCLSRKEFLLKMIFFSECGWYRYHPLFFRIYLCVLMFIFLTGLTILMKKGFIGSLESVKLAEEKGSHIYVNALGSPECLGVSLYKEIKCHDFTFILKTCKNCYVSNIHSMLKGQ